MNKFGRRLVGTDTAIDLDQKVRRCAMLDNCICSKSSDCGPGQVCGYVEGYWSHPVCRTLNDELVLKQVQKAELPINFVAWILETIPALVLTAKARCLAVIANATKTILRGGKGVLGW